MLTHSIFKSAGVKPSSMAASIQKKEHRSACCIQTKLTIGKSNDKYEQEADRVADQVVKSPAQQKPALQKKCNACEREEGAQMKPILQKMEEEEVQAKLFPSLMKMEEEEAQPKLQMQPDEELQTKKDTQPTQVAPQNIQTKIEQSKGGGSPLSSSSRSFMESRIGADFSNVRIHNDSNAHKLSTKLNAQAFAVGNNVFFNKGKFNPETQSGKHLLAHELTHTVQQGSSIQTRIQKQESTSGKNKQIEKDIKYINGILRDAFSKNNSSLTMTWQKNPGGLIVGYDIQSAPAGESGSKDGQFAINEVRSMVKIFYNSPNKYADLNFSRGKKGWLVRFTPRPLPKPKAKVKPKVKKPIKQAALEYKDVNTTYFDACSADELKILRKALSLSFLMIENALSILEKPNDKQKSNLATFFSKKLNIQQIAQNFKKIRAGLRGSGYKFQCHNTSDTFTYCNKPDEAYTIRGSGGDIRICRQNFFESSLHSQAVTLIHEGAHNWLNVEHGEGKNGKQDRSNDADSYNSFFSFIMTDITRKHMMKHFKKNYKSTK